MPVRSLTPADLPAALVMNNAAVPAVGALDLPALEHLVEVGLMALAVTDGADDTQLAGFCLVLAPGADYGSANYGWFGDRYDDFVYLDRITIDPPHQGQGHGRALYDHVEASTEATWFCLEVNLRPRNDASLAFHNRLGFVEVGQQETDYGALVSMQAKRLR